MEEPLQGFPMEELAQGHPMEEPHLMIHYVTGLLKVCLHNKPKGGSSIGTSNGRASTRFRKQGIPMEERLQGLPMEEPLQEILIKCLM